MVHFFVPPCISSVISKLFEHAVLDRFAHWFTTSDNQIGFKKNLSCMHAIYTVRFGVVALSVECRTYDQEVVGSSLGRARGVKTLGKFLTDVPLSPSSIRLRTVMPCGWGVKAGMVCVWVAGKTV